MNLKNTLIRGLGTLAFTGLVLLGAATAQPGNPEGRQGGGPMAVLTQRLSLSADQQAQVQAIFERHFAQAKARRTAFEVGLTPEQKAQMQARHQEKASSARSDGNDNRAANRGERPELTAEQKQQMQARRQQMQVERQQIASEIQAILTPQQRQTFDQLKADAPRHSRGDRRDG